MRCISNLLIQLIKLPLNSRIIGIMLELILLNQSMLTSASYLLVRAVKATLTCDLLSAVTKDVLLIVTYSVDPSMSVASMKLLLAKHLSI